MIDFINEEKWEGEVNLKKSFEGCEPSDIVEEILLLEKYAAAFKRDSPPHI